MAQNRRVIININQQTLILTDDNETLKKYIVSTAKNGAGELFGSECTPRGKHIISEKIGAGCLADTVFVGRLTTGELYHEELRQKFPTRDWILTRILWLSGSEPGRNKGGETDTHDRYIYIHGSPDDIVMGAPGSRGCIRMNNQDIIELFDLVDSKTSVDII